MTFNQFVGRWHGVGLTALVIFALHLVIPQPWFTPSMVLAFIPLTYTAYQAGLYPAISAAVLVAGYPLAMILTGDGWTIDWAMQIAVAAFAVAVPMGILKRRSRMSESASGNRAKLDEATLLVKYLAENWQKHDRRIVQNFFGNILDRLGNLQASVWGWEEIERERSETEAALRVSVRQRVDRIIAELEEKSR